MKSPTFFMVAVLLSAVLLSSGCTSGGRDTTSPSGSASTDEEAPSMRPSGAAYVGNFFVSGGEQSLEVRFSLLDSFKNYVAGDGSGELRIVNSEGETIYSGTFAAKAEDFGTYRVALTGQELQAYVWEIPVSSVSKSFSSNGKAYLKFRTSSAEFEELETDIILGLPTYTQDDLDRMSEEEYAASAVNVGESITNYDGSTEYVQSPLITATVTTAGRYSPDVLYGDGEEYFRIDMEVKNNGTTKTYFAPSSMVLLDGLGNQYEVVYGGTLDTLSQIYPGVTKSGYLLFEPVPPGVDAVTLVFEFGLDEDYTPFEYSYVIDLA